MIPVGFYGVGYRWSPRAHLPGLRLGEGRLSNVVVDGPPVVAFDQVMPIRRFISFPPPSTSLAPQIKHAVQIPEGAFGLSMKKLREGRGARPELNRAGKPVVRTVRVFGKEAWPRQDLRLEVREGEKKKGTLSSRHALLRTLPR